MHPTEIAFDLASAQRAVAAVKGHRRFGFNYDPSHLGYQGVDYVKFIRDAGRPHLPRAHEGRLVGPRRRLGRASSGATRASATPGATGISARSATATSEFEDIIVALNDVGYRGPLSVEWEDIRMDRVHGATEAAAFVRKIDFPPSAVAFDAAFERKEIATGATPPPEWSFRNA